MIVGGEEATCYSDGCAYAFDDDWHYQYWDVTSSAPSVVVNATRLTIPEQAHWIQGIFFRLEEVPTCDVNVSVEYSSTAASFGSPHGHYKELSSISSVDVEFKFELPHDGDWTPTLVFEFWKIGFDFDFAGCSLKVKEIGFFGTCEVSCSAWEMLCATHAFLRVNPFLFTELCCTCPLTCCFSRMG